MIASDILTSESRFTSPFSTVNAVGPDVVNVNTSSTEFGLVVTMPRVIFFGYRTGTARVEPMEIL